MVEAGDEVRDSQILAEHVEFLDSCFDNSFALQCSLLAVKEFVTEGGEYDTRRGSESVAGKKLHKSTALETSTYKSIPSQTINKNIASKNLKNWGLPEEIAQKYEQRGISEMFDWQVTCLANSKVLLDCCNLVYSAPTSAGKTLVAEILTIKTILERQKKVIIILPFVSIVREKMFYLQDILSSSGIRVEGFMGSQSPPGGLQAVHVAICTIEKANSLINRLLDDGNISELGAVIVDELHLLGDPHRGYILELLLTKIKYVSSRSDNVQIQIVGMSATLPNLEVLANWLSAELFVTQFRPIPLDEYCLVGNTFYNKDGICVNMPKTSSESDNVLNICLETVKESCSVLIFCMTKNRCENLAQSISSSFYNLGCQQCEFGSVLRNQLKTDSIAEVLEQLKTCPVGLDQVLKQTISFGVAYHHAGLTFDERDIIEGGFKSGAIRVLVATSTLSSGVNLPARKVIIRSPVFMREPINILTYKQMIGRAGRMGRDTKGESILICTENEKKIGFELMTGALEPVKSCIETADKYMRAVLEMIASQVLCTKSELDLYSKCTLLYAQQNLSSSQNELLEDTLEELKNFELVRIQNIEEEIQYVATPLGKACLSASMAPNDGLSLFLELQKARQCLVLETDLHLIYLVTPYSVSSQWGDIDWLHLLTLWESLTKAMKRVGELVGVKESFIIRCLRGANKQTSAQNVLNVHKRFYTALALQDLVNEVPLSEVATKFQCARGFLQSLQQAAATFAGMVTAFCRQLGWKNMEILISQFQDRLHFGIHSELLELMKLSSLNGVRARALFDSGLETVTSIASADVNVVENILHKAVPFQSEKVRDVDDSHDMKKRNKIKSIWITGCCGMTAKEAALNLITEARKLLENEIGVKDIKWRSNVTTTPIEVTNNTNGDPKTNKDGIKVEVEYYKNNTIHKTQQEIVQPVKDADMFKKDNGDSQVNSKYIANKTGSNMNSESGAAVKPCRISLDLLDISAEDACSSADSNLIDQQKKIQTTAIKEEAHSPLCEIFQEAVPVDTSIIKTETQRHSTPHGIENSTPETINNALMHTAVKDEIIWDSLNYTEAVLENITKLKSEKDFSPNISFGDTDKSAASENIMVIKEIILDSLNFSEAVLENITKLKSEKDFSPNISFGDTDKSAASENIKVIEESDIKAELTSAEYIKDISLFSNDGDNSSIFEESLPLDLIPSMLLDSKNTSATATKPETTTDFVSINSNSILNAFRSSLNDSDDIDIKLVFEDENQNDDKKLCLDLNLSKDNEVECSQDDIKTIKDFKSPYNKRPCEDTTELKHQAKKKKVDTVAQDHSYFEQLPMPAKSTILLNQYRLNCTFIQSHNVCQKLRVIELAPSASISLKFKQVPQIKTKIGNDILNIQNKTDDSSFLGMAIYIGNDDCFLVNQELLENKKDVITSIFESNKRINVHSLKQNYLQLKKELDTELPKTCTDVSINEWLMDSDCENIRSIEYLMQKRCEINLSTANITVDGKKKTFKSLDLYAQLCIQAWCISMVAQRQSNVNYFNVGRNVIDTEHQIALLLAKNEYHGITVDRGLASQMLIAVNRSKDILQKRANMAGGGGTLNLRSSKCVAKALGISSTGKVSTKKRVLSCHNTPLSNIIIYWRKLDCILTNILYPLTNKAHIQKYKIYPTYTMYTCTGRVSMHEPNLQNVPRTFTIPAEYLDPNENSQFIEFNCRNIFKASEGYVMVSADYCQLEMRVLTHFSEDPVLLDIMKSDVDVFKSIAASWSIMPEEMVDDDLRQKAKQLCYGILYGMGNKTLGLHLDVTEIEAAFFMDSFYATFPHVKKYTMSVIEECRKNTFVTTMNRLRPLPHIRHMNAAVRGAAERQAVNTTIQGTAADIAKAAMCAIDDRTKSLEYEPRLLLQMHDELIYEVPVEHKQHFCTILKEAMEKTVKLKVPLPVKVKSGYRWGTLEEIKL